MDLKAKSVPDEIFRASVSQRPARVPAWIFKQDPDVLRVPFGEIMQGYRVLERLGVGGFSAVYRARELASGRFVALKFRRDTEAEAGWQEATAWAKVRHTHVVRLLEARSTPLGAMLALELVEGESLSQKLRRGPLPWAATLELGLEILSGLEAVWAAGVVHRDVTPKNILLETRGPSTWTGKLTDLGLATFSGVGGDRQAGTPGYAAPEQVTGGQVDSRADLFGLGATLYRAVAGVAPFKAKDWAAHGARVRSAELEPATVAVPDPVLSLLVALLASEPSLRIPAARFRAEASALLRAASSSAARTVH